MDLEERYLRLIDFCQKEYLTEIIYIVPSLESSGTIIKKIKDIDFNELESDDLFGNTPGREKILSGSHRFFRIENTPYFITAIKPELGKVKFSFVIWFWKDYSVELDYDKLYFPLVEKSSLLEILEDPLVPREFKNEILFNLEILK